MVNLNEVWALLRVCRKVVVVAVATTAVQIYELLHIYTSHHFTPHGRYELNKLASLPMCGFIAQLVEHRTGIAEVTGSNPVEALIFSGFFFPIA